MSFFLKAFLAVAIGTALGLWATGTVVNRNFPFGAVVVGPWTAHPTVGSPAVDPYARAVLARTAVVPIGADEGIAFFATADDTGRLLTGTCDYLLEGGEVAARFWSLSLFDRDGQPMAQPAGRSAVTSQNAVRIDRRVKVAVAAGVQPGNWLPSLPGKPFVLMLSLYEPNSGTAIATASADPRLPQIRRVACRT